MGQTLPVPPRPSSTMDPTPNVFRQYPYSLSDFVHGSVDPVSPGSVPPPPLVYTDGYSGHPSVPRYSVPHSRFWYPTSRVSSPSDGSPDSDTYGNERRYRDRSYDTVW